MLWDAAGTTGPYPAMYTDFRAMAQALAAIGHQLGSGNTSVPLLADNRPFLGTPVADGLVYDLCTKVREEAHFPNVTDLWGQRLCAYYQVRSPFAWPSHSMLSDHSALVLNPTPPFLGSETLTLPCMGD